ncbi:MAG: CPXCG motif-containing cysteine-rich protein [Verrucomicrobia bacterium]|nr:CPXCG motif-containing cysteine-rich protein [Verrucomicrobiota bacterium]
MLADAVVLCPFCGQESTLALDTSIAEQRFVTDCEVCCRPFEVAATCEPGEVLDVQAQS